MSTDAHAPDPTAVRDAVARALAEDRADHDVTTRSLIEPEQQGRGGFLLKTPGIVCGMAVVRETFAQLSSELSLQYSDCIATSRAFRRDPITLVPASRLQVR